VRESTEVTFAHAFAACCCVRFVDVLVSLVHHGKFQWVKILRIGCLDTALRWQNCVLFQSGIWCFIYFSTYGLVKQLQIHKIMQYSTGIHMGISTEEIVVRQS
jgi:hypothetical protein